jgi:hypothetical protein
VAGQIVAKEEGKVKHCLVGFDVGIRQCYNPISFKSIFLQFAVRILAGHGTVLQAQEAGVRPANPEGDDQVQTKTA